MIDNNLRSIYKIRNGRTDEQTNKRKQRQGETDKMHLEKDPERETALKRAEELLEQRKDLVKLPPEEAMERILSYRQPVALVHSFPEEDFHLLVRDVGPEDSVPLLALASRKQWEYIIDMEVWRGDRIATAETAHWLDLLLSADSKRMIEWFLEEKTEFVEFYLNKHLEIIVREHDQDPSDFGDGFFTKDDTFYVRVVDPPVSDADADAQFEREIRHRFLETFLDKLARYDFDKYHGVLLESTCLIPPETEEEAFRLRSVRLAEKGFLPFDEAVGVYRPMSAQEIEIERALLSRGGGDPVEASLYRLRSPMAPLELAKGDDDFSFSLRKFSLEETLPLVESEFAALCNKIISADRKTIQGKDQLKDTVKKALGYLSVGMDYLAQSDDKISPDRMAVLIERYPLEWIFRAGYGLALDLKWRAQKWQRTGWFESTKLSLTFWDELWMGVLGGLLIKKPLFFDNYETGVIYREFESTADMKKTGRILEKVVATDRFLSSMRIEELSLATRRLLTYKNLLLTLWAKSGSGLSGGRLSMPAERFKPFFERLFDRDAGPTGEAPSKVRPEAKEAFSNWILETSGWKATDVSPELAEVFEDLFAEIENEYGRVSVDNLDPRFVTLFLLE